PLGCKKVGPLREKPPGTELSNQLIIYPRRASACLTPALQGLQFVDARVKLRRLYPILEA
ncbi:MAG: hypothetical protein R6V85_09665, partial [Polyangia bacterium]